uniref:Uncharacterized protein n=1 Tax=Cacopsylla melanoneura TaxID=428564 RepID=A0A8D9B7F7_9HEMI
MQSPSGNQQYFDYRSNLFPFDRPLKQQNEFNTPNVNQNNAFQQYFCARYFNNANNAQNNYNNNNNGNNYNNNNNQDNNNNNAQHQNNNNNNSQNQNNNNNNAQIQFTTQIHP